MPQAPIFRIGVPIGFIRPAAALFSACLLLFFASQATAQIYSWKDEKGRTVYSDLPPPHGATRTISSPSSPAAPERSESQTKRKTESAGSEQGERARMEAEMKRVAAENCDRARGHLRTLESGGRIYRVRPDGERYYLDDEALQKEIADAKRMTAEWCDK